MKQKENKRETKVDGLLFDKDGTLFDFRATWDVWATGFIQDLSCADPVVMARLANAMHFDLTQNAFLPSSPIIAGTNRDAAICVASALPGSSVEDIEDFLARSAAEAPLAPAVPLDAFLSGLTQRGMVLGVMTNDCESVAHAQLAAAEVAGYFDFIAGFDSGFGGKPDPAPLLAFAEKTAIPPDRIVMVGDSTHDLIAGRAAGMQTIGVLTGVAGISDLAPFADEVLPDIGHIPSWLAA